MGHLPNIAFQKAEEEKVRRPQFSAARTFRQPFVEHNLLPI